MNVMNNLFLTLQQTAEHHNHETPFYKFMSATCESMIKDSAFSCENIEPVDFGDFGNLILPYYSMGNIDSLKLFGLDELIIFAFYLHNKNKYKKTADMGANIGLHSILMSRLGWNVTAYEPDPIHVKKIKQHIKLNKVKNINICENAISNVNEGLLFTRLAGNRTGSHLKGFKENVYGDIDEFKVNCLALSDLMSQFDFIKMDIEGAEANALCSTSITDWDNTDIMLEVGSVENATKIWNHMNHCKLQIYSQKSGWSKINSLDELPTSYKEGSIFITKDKSIDWSIFE